MLSKLRRKRPTFVFAQLNIRVMPEQRGAWFEDPLGTALRAEKLGEVSGGGTLQDQSGEILWVGLDLELTDLDRGLPFAAEFLTRAGAPRGSKLEFELHGVKRDIAFGAAEGMGVYLDGVNLPAGVYQDHGADDVLDGVSEALGDLGSCVGHWQGATETALYFYGGSYEGMRAAAGPFLSSFPLCRGARVVRLA